MKRLHINLTVEFGKDPDPAPMIDQVASAVTERADANESEPELRIGFRPMDTTPERRSGS